MPEDTIYQALVTELGLQALSLLHFTVKLDGTLGHDMEIDLDEGVVSLPPELTAVEYLRAILIAVMRIMTGYTLPDLGPYNDVPDYFPADLMATA